MLCRPICLAWWMIDFIVFVLLKFWHFWDHLSLKYNTCRIFTQTHFFNIPDARRAHAVHPPPSIIDLLWALSKQALASKWELLHRHASRSLCHISMQQHMPVLDLWYVRSFWAYSFCIMAFSALFQFSNVMFWLCRQLLRNCMRQIQRHMLTIIINQSWQLLWRHSKHYVASDQNKKSSNFSKVWYFLFQFHRFLLSHVLNLTILIFYFIYLLARILWLCNSAVDNFDLVQS